MIDLLPPTERFKHIEIQINTACDLTCFGCDRFSDVVSSRNMTVDQVKLFVDESLDLGWEWERIRLLGGEPTLHPQFEGMVNELIRYRRAYSKCFLQILSNGLGKLKHYKDWLINNNISPHVEAKTKGQTPTWFNNTRIAPIDRDPTVGELPPCGIFGIRGCGIGLTRHGYFMDGAGAAIAMIAGFDIGAMTLKEVTWDRMQGQAKILCRVCGHWNPMEGQLVTELVTKTGEVTGTYWTERLKNYNLMPPPMKTYGIDK